jgi:hypothetical protein
MSIPSTDLGDDLIWGASAIRRVLNLESDAMVYGLLKAGELDGVVMRIGRGKRRRLCAKLSKLREKFEIATA